MRPESASSNPAMTSTVVDFPHPDRPNKATTPGVGASNATCSAKSSRRLSTDTLSMSAAQSAAHCAREPFRKHEPAEAEHERHHRKPQCQRIAVWRLNGCVERQRQRAGFAGNVGNKGDHRAELAKSRGERSDGAGQDAG